MAQVFPFRAFRYNPLLATFQSVLTQPYDKISPEMQQKYYETHAQNLITVEKGKEFPGDGPGNNVYSRAAAALQDWEAKNVIVQDSVPSFYAYTQEFTEPDTDERRKRRGFVGAGRLEEFASGVIFRHEHTLAGPKADRLELLRNTRTHTGQLFMLYADPQKRVDAILAEVESAASPDTEVHDEYDVLHRLWVVSDPQKVSAIQSAMADQRLVIADGHHRYETALNYRNERRAQAASANTDAPHERAMMTFVNTRGEGLVILPTHRVAANVHDFSWPAMRRHLEPWFATEVFAFANEAEKESARRKFLARLKSAAAQRAIGAYPAAADGQRAFFLLVLRKGADLTQLLPNVSPLQRELDVVLLHEGILEPVLGITPQAVTKEANLTYERGAVNALGAVDSGKAQISFLLNPCDVEEVFKIAAAGEVMPQKSTDFFPKLLSGITMYRV